ncbi:HU domain-containing protein [Sphingobacterium bovistauri]|uniref:CCDC81-like prokaryotic HU domain-containing protein n=1 Tax=Sphingobacterium bovistauri TaxID=2781959 RepID=A0ABS7Z2L6_9SPHI|nr:hypothetical protein [Sphingobacterium bovistauri]MCA5004410.1 hypothetical protein [Sphingobacterium bovistauri]
MILGRHIYSLLKRHSAVFVTGLGTFRRIRTSASFDAKRNVVLPPLSYIEFEYEVKDGYDFTLYVQQSQQLDKPDADRYVQYEIEKLVNTVNKDGQATLDELGQLVSYGNSYIFKPFDLSGFQFLPIEDPYVSGDYVDPTAESTIAEPSSEVGNDIVENGSSERNISTPQDEKSSLTNKVEPQQEHVPQGQVYFEDEPKRGNGMIYAIVAVLALIILGGIYYYSILSKKLDNVDRFIADIDSSENEVDTLLNAADTNLISFSETGEMMVDSIAKKDTIVTPPVVEEKVPHKYTIVIGTHPKLEQAEAEATEYQQKGFKHVRALPSNLAKNRKRVIWDTYPTKELRDSALRYVQKNVKSDAWPTVL